MKLLAIILLLISCPSVKQTSNKVNEHIEHKASHAEAYTQKASDIIKGKIDHIEQDLKSSSTKPSKALVNELVNISGIRPEILKIHHSTISYKVTEEDIKDWKIWYMKNKNNFYFKSVSNCFQKPDDLKSDIVFSKLKNGEERSTSSDLYFTNCLEISESQYNAQLSEILSMALSNEFEGKGFNDELYKKFVILEQRDLKLSSTNIKVVVENNVLKIDDINCDKTNDLAEISFTKVNFNSNQAIVTYMIDCSSKTRRVYFIKLDGKWKITHPIN